MMELSDEAKEARREYRRAYYKRNKERIKEQNRQYWERKAAEKRNQSDDNGAAGLCCR